MIFPFCSKILAQSIYRLQGRRVWCSQRLQRASCTCHSVYYTYVSFLQCICTL